MTGATEDHLIALAHGGATITIPSCRGCNQAKAAMSLPEFLTGDYFSEIRKNRHKNQWSLRDLWLALAWAAVECARRESAWTSDTPDAARPSVPVRIGKLPTTVQPKPVSAD